MRRKQNSQEFDVLQRDILISEKMEKIITTVRQEQNIKNNGKVNHAKHGSFFA